MRRFCSVSTVMGTTKNACFSCCSSENSHVRTPGERNCSETWEVRASIPHTRGGMCHIMSHCFTSRRVVGVSCHRHSDIMHDVRCDRVARVAPHGDRGHGPRAEENAPKRLTPPIDSIRR